VSIDHGLLESKIELSSLALSILPSTNVACPFATFGCLIHPCADQTPLLERSLCISDQMLHVYIVKLHLCTHKVFMLLAAANYSVFLFTSAGESQ